MLDILQKLYERGEGRHPLICRNFSWKEMRKGNYQGGLY
nr:MAG TPA: hypothetical protein [Caudoviricetes sp.]